MSNADNSQETPPAVAIIGAGQLGYLLCEAARPLGIRTLVVTPDAAAPALEAADASIVADYSAPGLAGQIAAQVDVVTFELEAVPNDLLEALQAEDLEVRPDVSVMQLLKNKASQKRWLVGNDIPTADFIEISAAEAGSRSFLDDVALPFVQKAQEGGYDGYGVQIIHDESDLEQLWPIPSIVETYLAGARELAVVVARSANGDVQIYPLVELTVDHERNILDLVIAPAALDPQLSNVAEDIARKVVDRLSGVGVFAVEMFLVDGQILVNEVSPRVHNSGHHTLESCPVSQFEQHMRGGGRAAARGRGARLAGGHEEHPVRGSSGATGGARARLAGGWFRGCLGSLVWQERSASGA